MPLAVRIAFAFAHDGFELRAFLATELDGLLSLWHHSHQVSKLLSTRSFSPPLPITP